MVRAMPVIIPGGLAYARDVGASTISAARAEAGRGDLAAVDRRIRAVARRHPNQGYWVTVNVPTIVKPWSWQ
jgi:hypothetical protein